nr:bifunctional acetate--CoA ligase family protein/GNAT family N-acetyltransferase [Gammaproteobacteria bacterium]
MTVRNLDRLFQPKSIAVIGASREPQTVGATLMHNLLAGGFPDPIMPVNPRYEAVAGVMAYPDIASLPRVPDLAIICTPAPTVPRLIAELGQRGTKAAVVVTAGLGQIPRGETRSLQQQMIEAAKPYLLRILGPNTVGVMVTRLGLNASFAHTSALPGKLAFVTQSGALATTVLDWAKSNGIGFSHFVSLGNSADVDFGDVLDYLASEAETRAILLYIEAVSDARKFMSATRAAARNKPVIAVKTGREPEGAKAAASHTEALAGSDEVYEAAIRRAGMLRVYEIEELFSAVETLARARPLHGDRLAIMTNGGGPGVMATDALMRAGGRLASLSGDTLQALDEALPSTWPRSNPVDIIGDAPVARYVKALKLLLEDPAIDAVLFIHAPSAVVSSRDIAQACVPVIKGSQRNVLGCWLGVDAVAKARHTFADAGIPTYDTPEDAVDAFMQMVNYRRNQELLRETPPSLPNEFRPDTPAARQIVERVLRSERRLLTEPESKSLLKAYGIPIVETEIVTDAEHAVAMARKLGFPVAVKVLSHQLSHKSDVGGVVLDLETAEAVRCAVGGITERVKALRPDATLEGFTVQRMARRPGAYELIIGATTDAIFGPVILFGQGGTAVEVIGDRAVALPPLNVPLARDLVSRTRVARVLAGFRQHPPAALEDIYAALVHVAQMVTDIPEIQQLDINPLLADEHGIVALDARLRVEQSAVPGPKRLAIRPYPKELEEALHFGEREVLLRPIRPEDEPAHLELFANLEQKDIRFRFFRAVRALPRSEFARLTQIDYDREMAFIATAQDSAGQPETLGVVRAITDPDNVRAEFALVVRSDLKGQGLGTLLLDKMIRYCRGRQTKILYGEALQENRRMIALAKKKGFNVSRKPHEGIVHLELELGSNHADQSHDG